MKRPQWANIVVLFLFLGVIFLPTLDDLFIHSNSKFKSTEKRVMAQMPTLNFTRLDSILKFPQEYESYFNDNFGFRNILTYWNAMIRLKLFHMSPIKSVIVGKNGWLFYDGDACSDGVPIASYRGLVSYSQKNLEAIRKNIEAQKKWLEERGIRYLIVIAPDKPTIYPEYMPDNIKVARAYTRTDQLIEYLKKSGSKMQILDLRDELRNAKSQYPVYYKTDHHWNRFGGFLAAQAIVRELAPYYPGLEPFSLSNYEVTAEKTKGIGNLAGMMAIPEHLEDVEILFSFNPLSLKHIEEYARQSPKIIIFHESFINAVMPFLSDHFRYIAKMRWSPGILDYRLIELSKPDLVIVEIEESYQGALE